MVESFARIQASLHGLSRREQRHLLVRGALGALAAWSLAWAALTVAVSWDVAGQRHGWLWIAGLVGVGLAVGAWPLRDVRAARDARRQALRVEALRPELKGALLTVLDRAAVPRGSPALLARLATRAAGEVEAVPPESVHPSRPLRRLAGLALASLALLAVAAVALPLGPIAALAALRATNAVVAPVEGPVADGPRALVGDITLRYLYPTYTGREPLEVPNSNGEVHAPPGTRVEVRARTGEVYEAAALVVYERPPEPVELVDGRALRAAFTVEGPGIWRFQFGDLPSPDYRIVPDPDLPPDVSVQSPKRVMTAAQDARLRLPWSARDDFGVTRVVIEVDERGKKREVPLRTLIDVPRELAGEISVTPRELGLAPGTTARLRVAAWDNDEVSGSKAGYSSVVEVEVVGPQGQLERHNRYRKLMRDALVLVLADFLLDPSPPVMVAADGPAWANAAGARYDAFDALVQEAWGGAEPQAFDRTVIDQVTESRRALLAFAAGMSGERLTPQDAGTFVALQDDNVVTIENAILMLDQVVRAAALAAVEELVTQIAEEATELQEDFASLDKQGALARLDQLDRLYQQLMREAAKLDEGQLREFVNDRNGQVQSLMEEIRKALREGRMEDAQELMDRLARTMQEMAQQITDMQSRRQQQSDELQKAMEQVQRELQQLEQDQAALRERTEDAREQFGQDMEEAVDAWEEVERLAGTVVEQLGRIDGGIDALKAPPWAGGSLLDEVRADAGGLHDSARARDLQTALQRADQVYGELGMLRSRLSSQLRRQTSNAEKTMLASRIVEAQAKNVQKIRELLEKMADRQATTSPALQRELQALAEQQQAIAERAEQTAERAGEVAENLPMDAPGLQEAAQRGAEQAGRAAEAMRRGAPMPAEGGQRAAEEAFREAQDALEQAQQNMRQMQQASRPRRGEQGGEGEQDGEQQEGGEESGEGDQMLGEDVALPAPEAFKTPEEYRRALLEGMEGAVPEEYKALNRRYYEELVRQ